MKCDRCGKRCEHPVIPNRRHDYSTFLAKQELLNLCDRCDGELHWKFAETIRAKAFGAEREEEAGRVGEIAGAVGADPPQSVRQGVAGRGPGGVAAISTAALGEGVVEALSPGAVRGVDGKVQAVRGDEGGLCGHDGATEEGDAPGVRALRLDPDEIGKFGIFIADPPWNYRSHKADTKDTRRAAEAHYSTMSMTELKALPVAVLAADDAVMYMWATGTHLREAINLLDVWGFPIKTQMVWVKPSIGMGFWVRSQHENILVGVRGKMKPPPPGVRISSVINAPRRRHSQKPETLRLWIDESWPEQRKLELFARGAVAPGWHAWGNEVQE